MKSTIEQLSVNERRALAALYEMDGYQVLKKIHQLELIGLGKDALASPNMEHVNYLKGKAAQSKETIELIRAVYKVNKDAETNKG